MFTKTKDGTPSTLTPAQEAVRGASNKSASKVGASIICSDMTITGSISAAGAIQIDGKVDGDITATDLVVGSTGEIVGEIKAETLRVKGQVKGSVRAKKVELETGATVIGDIIHGALVIQPDASFEGQVKREDNPLSVQQPKPAATVKPQESTPAATTTETKKPETNGFPASTSGNA
ncbi:MAG: polymer-forming cytoskeletal protein [Pseudomonadota bacterium]